MIRRGKKGALTKKAALPSPKSKKARKIHLENEKKEADAADGDNSHLVVLIDNLPSQKEVGMTTDDPFSVPISTSHSSEKSSTIPLEFVRPAAVEEDNDKRGPSSTRSEEEEEDGDSTLFYDTGEDSESSSSNSSSSSSCSMSSHSEEEEHEDDDASFEAELKGIERLQNKLDRRKERLRRLSAGLSPAYAKMMEAQEEAARVIRMNRYLDRLEEKERQRLLLCSSQVSATSNRDENGYGVEESKTEKKNDKESSRRRLSTVSVASARASEMARATQRRPSIVRRAWWAVLFELTHSVPCVFAVWVSTVGSSTLYGAMTTALNLFHSSYLAKTMTAEQYNLMIICLGTMLLRVNGALFDLLVGDRYTLAKIEMGNRHQLGTLDARLWKLIKGNTSLNSAFNLLGYYLVYAGFCHFYYYTFPAAFDSILFPWYYKNLNMAVVQLEEEMSETRWDPNNWLDEPPSTCFAVFDYTNASTSDVTSRLTARLQMTPSCGLLVEQVSLPAKWFMHYLCRDRSAEWDVSWLFYHCLAFAFAVAISFFQGSSILESCD